MPQSPPPDGQNETFKITEGFLKGFANKELQSFVNTRESPDITNILHYAPNGTGEPREHYDLVRPGHPEIMSEVPVLKAAHDSFSKNLQLAVRGLYRIASQMQEGLLEVDQIFINGEGDAALTAEEMVSVIGNVWKPPSASPGGVDIDLSDIFDSGDEEDVPDGGGDPDKGDDPGK